MASNEMSAIGGCLSAMVSLSMGFAFLAGWVTHVIVCIKASAWILLVFGCLFFPVGVIHGIGVWFGIF